MARKKQDIHLQRELESQDDWDDALTKEGLWVIDIYQEWAGPCTSMVSNFRRLKNELGDDFLHFAMAKADMIDALEKYRGHCEPCFLFFAGGLLVAYVHGADAPKVSKTLTEQLAYEHKVMEGKAERKQVKDPFVSKKQKKKKFKKLLDVEPEKPKEEERSYTVALIKPDLVQQGRTEEVIEEIKARGFRVVAQSRHHLTEDEAKEFYSHLSEEPYFGDLISFMTSGPCHAVILTRDQKDDAIIQEWRDMLGPMDVHQAKEEAPDSFRAKFGAEGRLMNGLHGADSAEMAAKELAFFFPKKAKKEEIQRTLAIIRPDAYAAFKDQILDHIKEAGFEIALQKVVHLTKEQAEQFYSEHAAQPYYEELVIRMSSGPMLALGLAREDAVSHWRTLLGPTDVKQAKTEAPTSLRAQFAGDSDVINLLHGSDSPEAAKKELEYFFPVQQTVAAIKPDAYGTREAIIDMIHEAGFRIAAQQDTTITQEVAETFYEDQKEQPYFADLVNFMTSGPTMFVVLSREDAVEGWRQAIGPKDPNVAKTEAPQSLRALFGHDALRNAVHGCVSQEDALHKIKKIFTDIELNPDGTVPVSPDEDGE